MREHSNLISVNSFEFIKNEVGVTADFRTLTGIPSVRNAVRSLSNERSRLTMRTGRWLFERLRPLVDLGMDFGSRTRTLYDLMNLMSCTSSCREQSCRTSTSSPMKVDLTSSSAAQNNMA